MRLRALGDEGVKLESAGVDGRCGGSRSGRTPRSSIRLRDCLGGDGDGDGDGLAFADFVFEDAQGFVERVNEEVDDAVVHGLSECGACAEAARVAAPLMLPAIASMLPA